MIQIRKAGRPDYALIQQMAHQTWPDTFRHILSEAQIAYMLDMMYSISALTEQIEKKGYIFLIARNEEKSLGFAAYELNHEGQPKTKLHKIYILPEAQGLGVGKLLINYIAEIAIKNQNTILSLNVNRHNSAVHFYKKVGFEKVAEEKIPIGKGFYMDDFVMDKSLGSSS